MVVAVDRQLKHHDEFLADVCDRLLLAQDYMKASNDKAHWQLEFEVSEWAWLRLPQQSAAGITDKSNAKLAPKFYGPFQVVERIGKVAYRLRLPAKA